mgnify:CR=1 FL=1
MKNISVIGIGKLGLCFALTLEKTGYNVVGLDINQNYVNSINNKTLKSHEENVEEYLKKSTNFHATTDMKKTIEHSDLLFVVVATPSLANGRYNHAQVESVIQNIKKLGVQNNKHFIVCCTTMPSYCDTVQQKLEPYGYTVTYNPEFIAQGTILRDQASPDMVLIGEGSTEIGDILENAYNKMTDNKPRICRMSRTEAEICKISLNCFLTTKISFANMIGDIASANNLPAENILNAIGSDTRIGNKYLKYGYGYGGPCFPRDNRALAIFANDIGRPAPISLATDNMNKIHLEFQIQQFCENTPIGETILLESVTYKPQTIILEESQQLAFAVGIAKSGHYVIIRETQPVINQLAEKYGDLFVYEVRK